MAGMDFPDETSFQEYARSSGHAFVDLTLFQADALFGTITLELFSDIAPRTCDNFVKLVEGKGQYSYKGSPIHRVVKQGYIQGGDVADGTGKGDPKFTLADETFAVKHDDIGILAMASNGEPHTAASQFYITLNPLPWLDGKRVAFGKVLTNAGLKVLKDIEELTLNNERPVPELTISEATVRYLPEQ